MVRKKSLRYIDRNDITGNHDTIFAKVVDEIKKRGRYYEHLTKSLGGVWQSAELRSLYIEEGLSGYPTVYPDIILTFRLEADHRKTPVHVEQGVGTFVTEHCCVKGCSYSHGFEIKDYKAHEEYLRKAKAEGVFFDHKCRTEVTLIIDVKSSMPTWSDVARQMKEYRARIRRSYQMIDALGSVRLIVVSPDPRWDIALKDAGITVIRPPVLERTEHNTTTQARICGSE